MSSPSTLPIGVTQQCSQYEFAESFVVENNDQNRQNGLKENISIQAIPKLNSKVRRRAACVGKCQKDHETYYEDSRA